MPRSIRAHPVIPLTLMVSSRKAHRPGPQKHGLKAEQDGRMGRLGLALGHHLQGVGQSHRQSPAIQDGHQGPRSPWTVMVSEHTAAPRLKTPHTAYWAQPAGWP
jgi:hypothetical protein